MSALALHRSTRWSPAGLDAARRRRHNDGVAADDASLEELREARARFLDLVAEIRPDLHRYCARMMGSVVDGEDVVQETLARALFRLPELSSIPNLRSYLFRVAHNWALDDLRRYERRMAEPMEVEPAEDALTAHDALARKEAMTAALGRFLELPPVPRSCVILKDVLGHTLAETAETIDLSIPAVKAALHRGRKRLRAAATEPDPEPGPPSDVLVRYVELFNGRDWTGVRALLAEDVRLDVVGRARRRGKDAAQYTSNYDRHSDWHFRAAWLEGKEVVAVFHDPADPVPAYLITLDIRNEQVVGIRDFRYVPYIAREASLRLLD